MHQHAPSPAPHSNAVPQWAQARRRKGRLLSGAGIIGALSGVIIAKINHLVVTALRQEERAILHSLRAWLWPSSMTNTKPLIV